MLVGDEHGYAATLRRMDEDLVVRGLPHNTRDSYLPHVRLFFDFCQRPVNQLTTEDIRRFLTFLITEQQAAPATANIYGAALHFLFAANLEPPAELPPNSPRETAACSPQHFVSRSTSHHLRSLLNVKHGALLALIYGSGLRVGEAASLRVGDIDFGDTGVCCRRQGTQGSYTILSDRR